MSTAATVSILIPAYNAESTLPECLDGIARLAHPPLEVILISDGSTDKTDHIAAAAGCRVIRNDGRPLGPSHARNTGARAAQGDWLLVVDADVVIAPDALDLLCAEVQATGAIAAFGSYDDAPRSQRSTSLYVNLRHHFVHQHGARDATTFWSGLGLVDRRAFIAHGGFDAESYPYPSVEDIDLGSRLIASGHRIRLVPQALGKHCKDWPLLRVWHTDVFRRAVPWAQMIVAGRNSGTDLNVSQAERWKALVALTGLATLLGGLIAPGLLLVTMLSIVLYFWLNRTFFEILARRLSFYQLAVATTMHWCYHIYAPVTFVVVLLAARLGLGRSARAAQDGRRSSTSTGR